MRIFLVLLTALFTCFMVSAQDNVGVGTLTPNSKALLDLSSNNKGFLSPRMTTSERLAISPTVTEEALMVFDTDLKVYFYWDGVQWIEFPAANGFNISLLFDSTTNDLSLTDAGGTLTSSLQPIINGYNSAINNAVTNLTNLINNQSSNNWSLSGNAGTNVSTNYIGTSDATGLSIRTNATERLRITASTGFVGIGQVPSYPLDVLNQVRLTRSGTSIGVDNESQLELFNGTSGDVFISFHKAGVWGAHFGLDNTNWFSTRGWSAGTGFTNLRTGSLQVNGTIQITGGSPQASFILQSNDAAGNATWVSPNTVVNNVNNSNNYNILPTGSYVGMCVRNTNDGCCNCNRRLMAPITGWGTGCPSGYSFEQIAARWNGLNEGWVYACIKN